MSGATELEPIDGRDVRFMSANERLAEILDILGQADELARDADPPVTTYEALDQPSIWRIHELALAPPEPDMPPCVSCGHPANAHVRRGTSPRRLSCTERHPAGSTTLCECREYDPGAPITIHDDDDEGRWEHLVGLSRKALAKDLKPEDLAGIIEIVLVGALQDAQRGTAEARLRVERRHEAELVKMRQELEDMRLRANLAEASVREVRRDIEEAAGELLVELPEPGTVEARLLHANRMLMHERDVAKRQLWALREDFDTLLVKAQDLGAARTAKT